jgi:hypothetical protein
MANNLQISAWIRVFIPLHYIFQEILKASSLGASLSGPLLLIFHYK